MLRPAFARYWRRFAYKIVRCFGPPWLGGAAIGGVAMIYAWLMEHAQALFLAALGSRPQLLLMVTPAVGALSVWLTRRYAGGAEGSGIPQTLAALHGDAQARRRLLSFRLLWGKIGISLLATAGGFPVGRQGPTVFIGAVLMHALGGAYLGHARSADGAREQRLVVAGAAAGLAAAFHTPLAGIAFAVEQLVGRFDHRAYGALLTAILAASSVAAFASRSSILGVLAPAGDLPRLLYATLLSGVVTGLAGSAFARLWIHATSWMPRGLITLRRERPVCFGALCGLLIATLALASGGATLATGPQAVRTALTDGAISSAYPAARMLALLATCLAGVPGGIFVPSLSIGAGIGAILSQWCCVADVSVFAALAMTGYLAAVTRSPVTAFVITIEMSGSLDLLLPLMTTALMANSISRRIAPRIYETLSRLYYARPTHDRAG